MTDENQAVLSRPEKQSKMLEIKAAGLSVSANGGNVRRVKNSPLPEKLEASPVALERLGRGAVT